MLAVLTVNNKAMLRLSKITDYGVVILSSLAGRRDELLSAADLAAATGISEANVAKVLKAAARGELVIGQRGTGGGYRLARPAAEITITDVIEAFEGPIALTACVDGGDGSCSVESFCAMRHNWDVVNQAVRDALKKVTLKDMATGRVHDMNPLIDFSPADKSHVDPPKVAVAE